MNILSFIVLACTTSPPEKQSLSQNTQAPIFIDLDGQNWQYPLSSIGPMESLITDPELKEGNRQYLAGEYKKAAQLIIPYIEENPEDAIAHSILAACFFRLQDLNQAEQAAQNAVQYSPNVISYSNLGSILAGKGKIQEAIDVYEKARMDDPKHFLPIRNLVTLYYNNRDLKKAEEVLYQLIQIDPTDSYGYVSLGQVLVEQSHWKEAEAVYRFRLAELKQAPIREQYLAGGLMLDLPLALGNVLLHQKKYAEAEIYFQKTLNLSYKAQSTWTSANTYRLKAYRGLVEIYMTTGEKEKEVQARLEFKKLKTTP